MADTRIVCKICLQPIDRIYDVPYLGAPESEWRITGWVHPRRMAADHEPEPIPAEEAPFIDQVCDFCGKPNLAWIFPTDVNQQREFNGLKLTEDAWAACELCHDVILTSLTGRDIIRRIAHRSLPLKGMPEHVRPRVVEMLAGQYQQFLTARTGNPIRLADYVS